MDKRPMLVIPALAAMIALAGCGNGAAGSASTDGPAPSPSTTSAPPTSTPPTSTPPATPAPGAAWTGETAYAACLAFHREKTAAEGYDPDASTWNAYSPAVARQNGAQWIVDLIGTVTGDDGVVYEGAYSCLVAGTPAAPVVSEYVSG